MRSKLSKRKVVIIRHSCTPFVSPLPSFPLLLEVELMKSRRQINRGRPTALGLSKETVVITQTRV